MGKVTAHSPAHYQLLSSHERSQVEQAKRQEVLPRSTAELELKEPSYGSIMMGVGNQQKERKVTKGYLLLCQFSLCIPDAGVCLHYLSS